MLEDERFEFGMLLLETPNKLLKLQNSWHGDRHHWRLKIMLYVCVYIYIYIFLSMC